MAEDESKLTEKVIAEGFVATAKDLVSYKAQLDRLWENLVEEHKKVKEIAAAFNQHEEEIARLKAWTGLPEKDDPRGPAPATLWGLAVVTRDLILRVCKHLGLPDDQILPPTKGGPN
jgi:hypothetical protein